MRETYALIATKNPLGPLFERKISALIKHQDTIFVASGPHIYATRRAKQVCKHLVCEDHQLPCKAKYFKTKFFGVITNTAAEKRDILTQFLLQVAKLQGHTNAIQSLLLFGAHIVSIGKDNNMILWDLSSYQQVATISFPSNFRPTIVMHPNTYLNKVLVGSEEGSLALYNLRTQVTQLFLFCLFSSDFTNITYHQKLVYSFAGWGSRVTCITQSPAVDVVAIGLADGRIIVHNLKVDKTLMTFLQAEGGITSLSFRTGL